MLIVQYQDDVLWKHQEGLLTHLRWMEFCLQNGVEGVYNTFGKGISDMNLQWNCWCVLVVVCWTVGQRLHHVQKHQFAKLYIFNLCWNQNLYVWSKSRPRVLKVKGEEIQKSQMIVGLRGCLIHTRSWTSYRFISWRFMLDMPFPKISSSTMKNGSEAARLEVQSLQTNSFIHTFSKYLSNVCCEPGIILHFCPCGA